jgi:hypothetical protein
MTADLQMVTLITVIANLIVTPLLQYMLQSKCDKISCCCGLIDLHRVITPVDENKVRDGEIV